MSRVRYAATRAGEAADPQTPAPMLEAIASEPAPERTRATDETPMSILPTSAHQHAVSKVSALRSHSAKPAEHPTPPGMLRSAQAPVHAHRATDGATTDAATANEKIDMTASRVASGTQKLRRASIPSTLTALSL
jgi:hypothetical protein